MSGQNAFGDQGGLKRIAHSVQRIAGAKVTTLGRAAAKRSPTHVGPLDPHKTFIKPLRGTKIFHCLCGIMKSFWKSRKHAARAPIKGTNDWISEKLACQRLNRSFWKSRNLFTKRFLAAGGVVIFLLTLFFLSCGITGTSSDLHDITIFYAPCFAPVIEAVKEEAEKEIKLRLRSEVSGSQVVCRKVTELGRECDIMMSADQTLFKTIASSHTFWRLDFSFDEVVLGVGIRAARIDEAEENWPAVLSAPGILLGRVDENLGPIGYRTLLCWKLMEKRGYPGIMEKLKTRSEKIVDHVGRLSALLKTGTIDYGFLYRTTCIKYDIRFIPLDPGINLGSAEIDYSAAAVHITHPREGQRQCIKIKGAPITYSLTIPKNAPNRGHAVRFIHWLLKNKVSLFKDKGFRFFKPAFFGSRQDYSIFKELANYGGAFH